MVLARVRVVGRIYARAGELRRSNLYSDSYLESDLHPCLVKPRVQVLHPPVIFVFETVLVRVDSTYPFCLLGFEQEG